MKYIIDTDKLPCNNGKNCTTCPFWSVDDTCEITEQVKKLPKYENRPHGEWVKCSDRLPTAEDGERVIVHLSFDKPACEYVYIPWKTVGFEYQVGHIDAWFAIPPFEQSTIDIGS